MHQNVMIDCSWFPLLLLLLLSSGQAVQAGWTRAHKLLPAEATDQVPGPVLPFKPHLSIVREGNPRELLGSSYSGTGINVLGDAKLLICNLQTSAYETIARLEARVDGSPEWQSTDSSVIEKFMSHAKEKVRNTRLAAENRPPSVVMVRNPVTRVLSAYIKGHVIYTFNYCWDHVCPRHIASFKHLIQVLEIADIQNVSKQFSLQLDECGFNLGMTYDCIIDYDRREVEWKQCLTKLGLWEEFGASGWGPNGDQSLFDESSSTGHDKHNNEVDDLDVEQYYTPELLEAVFRIYRKDFELFGYSRDFETYLPPPPEDFES